MRVLLQRVQFASVEVAGRRLGAIDRGLLILVGIGGGDGDVELDWMARKVASLRVFPDEAGKMNLDVRQVGGSVLSVSQFTLYADCRKGTRPSFDGAERPDRALALWKAFNVRLRSEGVRVEEGEFGADMKVGLVNDGPVTIWLDAPAATSSTEKG